VLVAVGIPLITSVVVTAILIGVYRLNVNMSATLIHHDSRSV